IVSSSGTYITTTPQSSGCDSSVTTLLTQIQVDTVNIVDTITHGGTYISPDGQTVIAPGHYTSVLPSTSGCDSVLNVELNYPAVDNVSNLSNDFITAMYPSPVISDLYIEVNNVLQNLSIRIY